MKINFAKRVYALLLAMLMIFSSVPVSVFAQGEIDLISDELSEIETAVEQEAPQEETTTDLPEDTPEDETVDAMNITSSAQLEKAILSGEKEVRITADFEIDRTFYIYNSITVYTAESHTLTRTSDFAGDIFVIGENSEGVASEETAVLKIGTEDSVNSDMLIIDGNSENMTVDVKGSVFFVAANGQADLYLDLTVKNCKKTGNERALDKEKYALCNDRTVIGGAVGIVETGGIMNIYGGKYTSNGVAKSGVYGGAFFNHGTINVYDGVFENNYASRAGVFYNYRKMNIYKATISNNTATSMGGAIYLPSTTGAILNVGGTTKAEAIQVVFSGNTASYGGAISSSGTVVLRNTLLEANTSTNVGGAVYGTGSYDNISAYNSEFRANKSDADGGAVYIKDHNKSVDVELDIRESIFEGNEAQGNGGAVYISKPSSAYIRDVSFNENKAADGGAIYVNIGTCELNDVIFSKNSATSEGGSVYAVGESVTEGEVTSINPARVIMNKVTATENSAKVNGGFAYGEKAEFEIYNSSVKNNTAKTGSAFYFNTSASADMYKVDIEGNACFETNTGNAGALMIYTGGSKVTLHTCNIKNNTSNGAGGGIIISNKSILDLYNVTATGNSALKGGFMYETTTGTTVTVSGLTVSGNTVSGEGSGGSLVWGNSAGAKLFINKSTYTDLDVTTELDDAYWKSVIANKLTVSDSDASAPEHADYVQPDFDGKGISAVRSARQLELALKEGYESLCIAESFEIDRTFYITSDIQLYSEKQVVLTRAADFAGDIFVVGEASNGVTCENEVTLTLGKTDSSEKDMLIIDGNKDNMTTNVNGTVIFVCPGANAVLYDNLTVRNCKKVDNSRTLSEAYGVSYPKYVGGAVGILSANAKMTIYGGTYSDNSGNMSGNSTYGGAFYNFGTLKVYGGTFSNNSAMRAGVFYNYRKLYIYKAVIENNSASVGGAIYLPASTGALLYIGTDEEGIESGVSFISNTSTGNGGAVYCAGRMTVADAEFIANSAAKGGAIYGYGDYKTITVDNSSFSDNTAADSAAAIYLHGESSYADRFELQVSNTDFTSNTSGANGAVYLSSTRAYFTATGFTSNTSATSGAAVYITGSKAELDTVSFTSNESTVNGGALYVGEYSEVDLININASQNASDVKGGFADITDSVVVVYDSNFSNNTSASAGAISLGTGAETKIYNTVFDGNKATAGNGGALDITTAKANVMMNTCTFTANTSSANGGAVNAAGETQLVMYKTAASGNSAINGGFMNVADNGTVVTLNGMTVSGNSADNAPVIRGENEEAVLNISKKNYVDSDASTTLDDAYWAAAISGQLTVNVIDGDAPPYPEYGNEEPGGMWDATDVTSAEELENALKNNDKEIRITKSFEIDRTFYITSDTVIFATSYVTLKRASDFVSDIFVIGQSEDGTPCEEQADLTVGIPSSTTKNRLIIDGNKDNMTVDVNGTVFFVCANGHVNLYENLTVKNCKKVANERTLETVHGVSYPEYIGAAVGIIAKNATMDIYGGTYTENSGKESGKSGYGGAFYNFGTMNIYGGAFTKNRAYRAGVFYNYRVLNIYNADISSNYASTSGGAIYMPSSTGAFLYVGKELEGVQSKVTFTSNTSDGNGGAIYANNVVSIRNAVFEKNKSDNGGAIASYSAVLTVDNSAFNTNSSSVNGGAIFVSGNSSKENAVELTVNNTTFNSNKATVNGGALYVKAEAASYVGDCTFEANTASADTKETKYGGGAVYVTASEIEFEGTEFIGNTSAYNGGAVVLNSVEKALFKNIKADGDKAENNGGFLYATASSPKFYSSEIKNAVAVNGGAVASENSSTTDIIKTALISNSAACGGAVYVNTGSALIHSSIFTDNTATDGGAIKASGESLLELYNTQARGNSAVNGGVLFLTDSGTVAKLNLMTVKDNTATTGSLAYSVTTGVVLEINKNTVTDENVSGSLDKTYWIKAVAGWLSVKENNGKTPGYAEYGNESYGYMWNAKDASTADELQQLLNEGTEYIRIVADFEIDRTFEIKKDAVLFATKAHTLKRASDFGGVAFKVVSDGEAVTFGLGNSESVKEDLLVIDGNKAGMSADVTDSLIIVEQGCKLEIYNDITVKNSSVTAMTVNGDVKINGGKYTDNVSDTASAVIVSYGNAEINGGTFSGNTSKANGGVISNYGKLVISGGTFTSNSAVNGGVIYNEGTLEIAKAEFSSNKSTENGGVIMSAGSVSLSDTKFDSNKALSGGAIYILSDTDKNNALVITSAAFTNNKATENGGAVFGENSKLTITAEFEGNNAKNGGSVYVTAGSDADFADIKSTGDSAKEKGGFLYCDKSTVNFFGGSVEGATAKNAGAVYIADESTLAVDSTSFENNKATENGGAIYLLGEKSSLRTEDASFKTNSAENHGGAVYASKGELFIKGTSFDGNTAVKDGGVVELNKVTATVNSVTAENNKAENNGGFLHSDDSALNITDIEIKNNTAKSGGAMMLEGDTVAECNDCIFTGNSATDGGALGIETDRTKVVLNRCSFTSNIASQNGGAAYIASGSVVELYNVTASKNTAAYGAVIYETTSATDVTVNGMTVSGNTATKEGYIIYGNSARAILRINKSNFIDKNEKGSLNSVYWSKAIAGKLKVKDINEPAPEFGSGAVDVSDAQELEDAINADKKYIRIVDDFEIERTYFIKSDVTIFSDEPHTLTRNENFPGDIFVIGEDATGERAFFENRVVKLTIGNPLSEKQNLLTIDGNKDNMKTEVTGSVFFVCYGANVDLYDNLTVINCFKQGNERTHGEGYRLSRPDRVGGAVAIIANGVLNIYGGNYNYNKVNRELSSAEEDRVSSIGGAFYNSGSLVIRGGNFIGNEGARGGIVYNYKIVKIIAGTFKDNAGTKYSGIYYSPSSAGIHFIMGNTDEDGDKLLFKNNTSALGAGAVYSQFYSAVVVFGNTTFKNNKALKGNGGAIYVTGALTVKNSEFIGNEAAKGNGGAVYVSRSNNEKTTRLVNLENCTFSENSAKNGGALATSSSAASSYSLGSIVTVKNSTFKDNISKTAGGAVYSEKLSNLTVENSSFIGNKSSGEAGAMYIISKADVKVKNSTFEKNTAVSSGGAISLRSAYLDIDGSEFIDNYSDKNAGAIYHAYSSSQDINAHLTLRSSTFKGNKADNGGAIYATRRAVEEDAVLINAENTVFEENKATAYGGALYLTAGVKTYFNNVSFNKNNAVTSGGAVRGSNSFFEIDNGTFNGNTSKVGGAIALGTSAIALMNNVQATENASTSNGGFLYSEGGTFKLYNSTVKKNTGLSGGAMYLYTGAVSGIYNTTFEENANKVSSSGSTGNGGALFIYTGGTETTVHSCTFKNNETAGSGGALYISGVSNAKLYNNTATGNKASSGGFMYETKAGTVVDVIGLTVSGNTAEKGGSIIWGNTYNAVMNIDKSKYEDKAVSATDDAYWSTAVEGKLTVNDVKNTIAGYEPYVAREKEEEEIITKTPVSVEDVFALGKNSSDADINDKYNKLKKLDNSSNLMSRATAEYPNINGKTVMVDTFVYPTKGTTDNGIVGLGILLYQSLLYKKAYPKEEVHINVSSYRFSVQAAVNINRNSRYFGYMRNLVGINYDEYGFVRLSYLLITAAKMGIHVNVIGQIDAYPISDTNPNFYEYFTQQLSDPCDPKYVKNGVIGDYLDFNQCYWTLGAKGGTDMMHTKMCTVSHYLDMNGVVRRNAVWSSSSNLDGVKADGQNANWKLQTASIVTNHDEIYRVSVNYLQLIASLCGQEEVIEFQEIMNARSEEQIALINQGRSDEIPDDEQIVYIGTPQDDIFELYFTPFGGGVVAWDEVHNPYCKYLREMYESEDYILFTWNSAEYSAKFTLGRQIEDIIIRSFHENRNVKNKIYSYMEGFDATTFDDLVEGVDIGYKSFFEKPFGKVHNKDVQLSYVKNGQRYFVTLLNSLNMHAGSMCYQSNFVLVVKEKSCAENGVFSTIAKYSTTGDIAAHSYSDIKTAKATKNQHGYTYRECIYCKKQEIIDTVHQTSDWIVKKEATGTESGIRYKKCTICNDVVKTEEIARKTLTVDITTLTGRIFSSKSSVSVGSAVRPATIEARIQIPKSFTDRAGVIVGNYTSSGNGIINLEVVEKGKVKVYVKNGSKVFNYTFSKDIRSDEPVDIAVVFESGKAVLYVNGTKTESVKRDVTLPSSVEKMKVGRDNRSGNAQYFKGRIYYVNLFSTARKESLIKKDRFLVAPDTTGLIYSAYYTSDKQPVTATLSSQSFTAKNVIKLKDALSATPKTIEATISLPTSVKDRGGVIFGNYNEDYKSPFNLEIYTNGRVRLSYKNNGKSASHIFKTDIRTSSGTVNIAVTLSGKTAVLYVDGVKKETAKLSVTIPNVTKNFCIGGDNRKKNSQYFKGKIYSINVFSDVRTDSEIKRDAVLVLSNESKLLYSSYIINDNDSSKIGRVALTGQTFTENLRYKLPGSLKSTPLTIEATVQVPKSISGKAGVIFGNYTSGKNNELNLSVVEKGKVQLYFKIGGTKVQHTFKTDIRTSVAAMNIAVTISGKKATLYVNGEKAETATLSKALPKITDNFCIGGDNRDGNTSYFKGKIYAVNLFNDVRTASEIKKDAKVVTSAASGLLYSGYFYGEKCEITSVGKAHTLGSWKTHTAATSSECGVKYKKCTACGKSVQFAEIKKTNTKTASVDYSVYNGKTFNSVNDRVSVNKNLMGNSFTVEAFVKLSPDFSERAGTIIGNYDGSDADQFNIEVYTDGILRLYYKVNGKAYTHNFSADVRAEKKTHIALTVDGKNITLYVNGKQKETYTTSCDLSSTISNLQIGGDNRADGNLFKGTIYSVNLFNSIRTSTQVSNDAVLVLAGSDTLVYSETYKRV